MFECFYEELERSDVLGANLIGMIAYRVDEGASWKYNQSRTSSKTRPLLLQEERLPTFVEQDSSEANERIECSTDENERLNRIRHLNANETTEVL